MFTYSVGGGRNSMNRRFQSFQTKLSYRKAQKTVEKLFITILYLLWFVK